jgi:polysaccharide export outer membrane protein
VSIETVKNEAKRISGLIVVSVIAMLGGIHLAQAQQLAGDDSTAEYQIGPGDVLDVFVWRQDDLSTTVPVRPDGLISTPLVEDMKAAGKTPSELARDIEDVLSEYVRSPDVTVIVKEFVGTVDAQVRVLGEAVNPGNVPFREGMTVLTVVLEVGGLTEFARANRSKLVRTVDGKVEETRIKLGDLLEKGRLDEDHPLKPGDVIVIPRAVF